MRQATSLSSEPRTGKWRSGRKLDLLAAAILLVCPAIFLADVLVGGKVLLPVDDLFTMPPWQQFAGLFGINAPHNHLIADMILQNYGWKSFAKDAITQGSLPLWNPYLLGGVPFLAAGQYAVLYPLGVIYYLLPVAQAYAWFTLLHLFLGGLFMYVFMRVLGISRAGAVIAGLAFAFSGFLVVSFVWPMVVSTAIWLPLLLALIELSVRDLSGEPSPRAPLRFSPWLWPILGAIVVATQFLAGHMEISFYVLFSAGFYAAVRLAIAYWTGRRGARAVATAAALLGMVAIGGGLAAAQLIPFAEAISANFRAGFVSYQDVVGYALPKQRLVSFVVPDFFGNPSVHSYFDPIDRQSKPVAHLSPEGKPVDFVADWDRKNYVEAASYVGILPLLLAGVALFFRRNRYTWIFAAYGLWSLLLAFGSPLYRLFFYGIPGFDQLHTPFRWLFPYTLSVTALAGIGAGWLGERNAAQSRFYRLLVIVCGLLAGLAAAALAGALVFHARLLPLAQELVGRSLKRQEAFGDGRVFFAFEWRNVALAVFFLAAGAVVLYLAAARARAIRRCWAPLAIAVVVLDLFVFGADFNTKADPAMLDFVPPSVSFLQADPEPFRIISFGEDDVLTPNAAMRFGIEDARGYDTIIPRQFVDFWSVIEDPRGYLIYSKIHKLRDPASLRSPLLDLLNVKYVLTTQDIQLPRFTKVYQGELNIYRNESYLPRAFLVQDSSRVEVAGDVRAALAALRREGFDPRRDLVIEGAVPGDRRSTAEEGQAGGTAQIMSYAAQRVEVLVKSAKPGYLVLADSYFPGWVASVDEAATTLYRADANFRAVYVPGGEHMVTFHYSPTSFRAGLVLSGASLALLLLAVAYLLRPKGVFAGYGQAPVQRVFKNSLTPMASSLINKLISAAFAMVVLRVLGPEGAGKYTFAIVIATYFEIFTNFGLNTLLTREVARNPESGNRFLSNTTFLRLSLWLLSVPLVIGLIFVWRSVFGLDRDSTLAILLLCAALVPGNISAGLSSLFYARERMEYPAAVSLITLLLTVGLGVVALSAGAGFVGLAAVALVVNCVTAAVFLVLVWRKLFRPSIDLERRDLRGMMGQAAPLMLNHLLATVFFRIDVLLLQPMHGDKAVGYYGTGYRFIDALNIIPSAFTMAIFPLMSRYAESGTQALVRTYARALKLMLIISAPITVGTMFLAQPIILLFAGPAYLPHAAIALQVLIWFLPFSFVNSVTQYVLIAVNQQRFITVSFLAATSFNIVANLLVIPRYSYVGAAAVTIASEMVLLVPFLMAVWRHVGPAPLAGLAVRPAVATAVMGLALWTFAEHSPLLLVPLGATVYALSLLALGTFDQDDRRLLAKLLKRGEVSPPEETAPPPGER